MGSFCQLLPHGRVNCVEMICKAGCCAFLNNFKHIVDVTAPESGFAFNGRNSQHTHFLTHQLSSCFLLSIEKSFITLLLASVLTHPVHGNICVLTSSCTDYIANVIMVIILVYTPIYYTSFTRCTLHYVLPEIYHA